GDARVQTAERILHLDGVTIADGQTTTVSASFEEPAARSLVHLDFRQDAFYSMITDLVPRAEAGDRAIYIDALPRYSTFGQYDASPDLAIIVPLVLGHIDVNLDYGNPLPTWDQFVVGFYFYSASYLADGAT